MRFRFTLILKLVIVTLTCEGCVATGGLRRVWELDLKTVIREPSDPLTPPPVFALRFSPDGRRIAAVVHLPRYSRRGGDRLLVIETKDPELKAREFEIEDGVFDDDNGHGWLSLAWTASGDSIVALGTVIQVEKERTCKVPIAGQADSNSSHDGVSMSELERRTVRYLVLDAACVANQVLDLPRDWHITDVSADRRLLYVWRDKEVDKLIVEPFSKKVIREWPISDISGGLQFADSDRAVCETNLVEHPGKVPVACWDLRTGQKIGEAPTINGGLPAVTAAHASRMLASDYRYIGIPFSSEHKEVLQRRVVWDFRTGKELAAWPHASQEYEFPGIDNPPLHVKEPYKFAISPDGQYVVEGGAGIIRLYKIEP